MSSVTISFLGAADSVTGSRFLIATPQSKVLVDCGLFQGLKKDRLRNWQPFPVNPSTIDAVVLTHSHLDHCGSLPLITRHGFEGKIYSTHYSRQLASVILNDSAHLQMEDAKYAAKKGYSKHNPPLALYNTDDVERTLKLFSTVAFHTRTQITDDVAVTFYPSGHILGAAFVVVEAGEKRFLFTGDLGRNNHPLLTNPESPQGLKCDVVVTESTYGDRIHDASPDDFAREINAAVNRGGTIVIPAFAVDRTEVILMALHDLVHQKKIPLIPIYVDSPMAISALNFYREAIATNTPEIRDGVSQQWANQDPFDSGALNQAITSDDSKKVSALTETCIIISASGMATGGRVVHHLEQMLPDPRNTVILVGYQAVGSRGRLLEEGVQELKMHGRLIPVNAHIAKVESFSVHADGDELLAWLRQTEKPTVVYVVHGEQGAQEAMADRLQRELNWNAVIPTTNRVYSV